MLLSDHELFSHLKRSHPRFQSLFEKHHQLDKQITELEGPNGAGYNDKVIKLKKEKLHLKDEMQRIIHQQIRLKQRQSACWSSRWVNPP